MELDALIRLRKQGVGLPELRGMLTHDIISVTLAAIILPVVVNIVLEVMLFPPHSTGKCLYDLARALFLPHL
jgi:hypothetical protein